MRPIFGLLDEGIAVFDFFAFGGIVDHETGAWWEEVEISPEALVDGGDQDIGKTDDILDGHVMIGTVIPKGPLTLFRPLCEFVYGIVIFL